MNIVTEIEQWTKSRVKIYIDQQFAFALYKGELRLLGIKKGEPIEDADYEQVMTVILPKRAKLRSMNLMKTKDYTEWQLRDKLKQGFYPEEVIDEALEYVKSYHYIDDERYARSYIVYHSESRSRTRIEMDLLKKGVHKEIIKAAYDEALEYDKLPDEAELITKLLRKKHYCAEEATYEEKQKMTGFLYRKGFRMDAIRRAL